MDASAPHRRRGLPTRWAARAAALIAALAAALAVAVFAPLTATAHPISSTAILLDTDATQVTGEIELPIDRLAVAFDEAFTAATVRQPDTLERLRSYVAERVSATTSSDGTAWAATVSGGTVENVDAVDHLVFDLTLTPPTGLATDFVLHYDGIIDKILSHRVLVSARAAGTADYTAVGLIDWQSQVLTIPVTATPTTGQSFGAAVHLGVEHISEGADHLLFLIMLLLPAPLIARRGRWTPTDDVRRSTGRIVHVVTAFAIGHSLTLALAAFGLVSVPTRIVESAIALSIVVSGIHAIRPLARRGETWIALIFGLMHGLAFAALLGRLDLGTGSLVVTLLGFNLGIELTQLIVVALIMPSLILLSRTRVYPGFRLAVAGAGVVLALAWLVERSTLTTGNPFEPVTDALVAHPFVVAGMLAVTAVLTWSVPRLRRHSSPTDRRAGSAMSRLVSRTAASSHAARTRTAESRKTLSMDDSASPAVPLPDTSARSGSRRP